MTLMFTFRKKGGSSLGKGNSPFKVMEAGKCWCWHGVGSGAWLPELQGGSLCLLLGKALEMGLEVGGGYASLCRPGECFELYWVCMVSLSHFGEGTFGHGQLCMSQGQ